MRDTLFIGHANPEDNEFTLWLQAKLINEGYKAECDLSFLTGGEEDYWKSLQELLENNSAKYLLVLSKDSFKKQGVVDEWEQVKSIAKKYKILDFIYVLKIDDVPFDVRIGVPTKNHFRFDISWAKGLKQLFIKLHKDSVPKTHAGPLSIEAWSKNRYATITGILERQETYYSNWLLPNNLPDKFYIFCYGNSSQAELIEKNITNFPLVRHDNHIITFSESLPVQGGADNMGFDYNIVYKDRIEVKIENAFKKTDSIEFPVYDDIRRFLVRLLKEVWNKHLQERGLKLYELSSKTKCFFYLKDQLPKDKVFFTYNDKSTYKQLVGEFGKEAFWHYGISTTVLLNPEICFSLRAHLLFSDDGSLMWSDKKKIHKARRSKGKSFFNKEWRGLMLAFIAGLSDNKSDIQIAITENAYLTMPITPMVFTCDFDYEEPKTNGRIIPLDYFDEMMESDEEEDEQDDGEIKPSEMIDQHAQQTN